MNKRIFYLDFLRSFAIVMVLILHSISDYMIQPRIFGTTSWYAYLGLNAVARTGVPIFFMISGCLLLSSDTTRDFKKFYKKSLPRIIIPLVFWNTAYFAYKCIMGHISFDIRILLNGFINSGTEYHLWYLYTLFSIYLVAPFLKMLVDILNAKQQLWLLFLMLLCTTIRPFINQVTPLYIYLFEPLFNGYIGYFLMGYILSNIKTDHKITGGFCVAGLMGLVISIVYHHTHSSADGINLDFNYGYSLCHFVMAIAIFVISKLVFSEKTWLKKPVSVLSGLSFGVYLVHIAVIDLVLKYFMIDASPILSSLYIFTVTINISAILSFALGKIKYINKVVL